MKFNLASQDGKQLFNVYAETLMKKGANVELIDKSSARHRTNEQNRTLHLWLRILANHFGYLSLEECKRDIKREILGMKESVNRITGEVIETDYETKRMTTKELADFLSKLKIWAQTEYNIYLPMYTDIGYNELLKIYGSI